MTSPPEGTGSTDGRKGDNQDSPRSIGPYTIVEKIGAGGMGVVYLAELGGAGQRRVAVKVVQHDLISEDVIARFQAEQHALSLMDHPGIARVIDAGSTEDGQPYFVMDYIDGTPITKYCDDAKLTIKHRLELFIEVCDAVQHAHHKGILHRDIKPSNVMVTEQSGRATPTVIDFGIAKATGVRLTEDAPVTLPGQMIGTPEYMSPEQAISAGQDVDTRTDVYSMGVLLYKLLCDALPLNPEELRSGGALEMEKLLRDTSPTKPSERAQTISIVAAAARKSNPTVLRRSIRGDLDWIVLRALEKNRSRRYPSVRDLGDDLQRHLDHVPIFARPATLRYRLGRVIKRHTVASAAGALVALALVTGLLFSLHFGKVATAKTADFDQLAGVLHLRAALSEESGLIPAWPHNINPLRDWLANAKRLVDMRPKWEATIARIQTHPAATSSAETPEKFLLGTLQDLVKSINSFHAVEHKRVRKRLLWAERIESLTQSHPRARESWRSARESIARADGVSASASYRHHRIDLVPQIGLVPIGMNPRTKLWEFYHLRSAWDPESGVDPGTLPIPKHRPDGSIPTRDGMGMIFVLIPGNTFTMGAQRQDRGKPNYDSNASPEDRNPREESVDPFFIARHEVTQGQWFRLHGEKPSAFGPGMPTPGHEDDVSLTHPVEQVSWNTSCGVLVENGLALPSEKQWEYACRAGTQSPWHSGVQKENLAAVANLLDQHAKRYVPLWPGKHELWNDGHSIHAPVGSYAPNAFGLFDMHGNVREWCLDLYPTPRVGPRGLGERTRVLRGGCFNMEKEYARVTYRTRKNSTYVATTAGFRAARPIIL